MKKTISCAVLAVVGAAYSAAVELPSDEELAKLVAADIAKPVKPIQADGKDAWNANAVWFMYPPTFAFQKAKGWNGFRIRIVDAAGKSHVFFHYDTLLSLEKYWPELPVGRTEVWCESFHRYGHWIVGRDFRVFWKMAPYKPGAYSKAERSYADAAKSACAYILNLPWMKTFVETGKPDPDYALNCYPSKIDTAIIDMMLRNAELSPEDREASIKLARTAADYLISISMSAEAPLAHFPPTYKGKNYSAGEYGGTVMLVYPAAAGSAYLKLYEVTREEKYLDAAKGIAETYLRYQGEDGTWALKLSEKTGQPSTPNRLHPGAVISFMESLYALTKDERFAASAERAFAFFENGPLKDYNWEGQFEDTEPSNKYENLTKHPPCVLAIVLAERWSKDEKRLAQARELLRYAEDQFVVWELPKRPEEYVLLGLLNPHWAMVPSVVEQYFYREPIDSSVARLITTYLALYKAEGNPLDLAKARTLGDSLVRIQRKNGRIPTIWSGNVDNASSDWINCMAASIRALCALAEFDK